MKVLSVDRGHASRGRWFGEPSSFWVQYIRWVRVAPTGPVNECPLVSVLVC
jgi:hypothetical protein